MKRHYLAEEILGTLSDSTYSVSSKMIGVKQKSLSLLLALILAMLDQWSKYWVQQQMSFQGSISLIPHILQMTLTYNTGAAFSLFHRQPQMLTLFSGTLLFGLVIYTLFFEQRSTLGTRKISWPLVLIMGGALGNFMDRLRFGHVIDFIDVIAIHYPIFNLADSFICCGVALWILHYYRTYLYE